MKVVLVMSAISATSERSFSALKRVKTYLRSTMTPKRLNHLMLLHVRRAEVDELDPAVIGNLFVVGSQHRQHADTWNIQLSATHNCTGREENDVQHTMYMYYDYAHFW